VSRASELEARIASIAQLLDVVTAMRSLAASRVQRAERALPGVRHYADIMDDAIGRARSLVGEAFATAPPELAPRLIVVCSEHGFAGAFNERLLDRAAPEVADHRLWIVGTRGLSLARTRGLAVEWTMPMATHVAGVFEAARRLGLEIERRVARGELGTLAVLSARRIAGEGTTAIERRPLLPLASSPRTLPPIPPVHHVPAAQLLGRMIGEFVVGELSRVLVESFASENAARLRAMEAAHRNIETKLDALRGQANRYRQEDITAELLDVITGAEAVRGARA